MPREKIEVAHDADGTELIKGDTVATIGDNTAARVADLCIDMDLDLEYVRLKPLHQAYGKGLWHAADRVIRLSATKRKTDEEKEKERQDKEAKAKEKAKAKAEEKAKANGKSNGENVAAQAATVAAESKSSSRKKPSKKKVSKKKA